MKKLITIGVLLSVLMLGNAATANTPETRTATPLKMPSSNIDGIEVPFEVIEYAQLKYQGHAITQVSRSFRNGQPAYQVRVDNDDILTDDDCIFLWYDMKWKLMGEGKAAAQPIKTFYGPSQPIEQPKDRPSDDDSPEHRRHERPDHGREEPAPEPEEPDEDDEPEPQEPRWPPPNRGRGRG